METELRRRTKECNKSRALPNKQLWTCILSIWRKEVRNFMDGQYECLILCLISISYNFVPLIFFVVSIDMWLT